MNMRAYLVTAMALIGVLPCVAIATDASDVSQQQAINSSGHGIKAEMSGAARSPRKGDEWEYASIDMFGKKQVLIARVLESNSSEGIVEEFGAKRGALQEFAFNNRPTVVFNGSNSIAWFSPYWDGKNVGSTSVLNKGNCTNLQYVSGCKVLRAERLGSEKVTVPAGTFDADKLKIEIDLQSQYGSGWLILTAWYSKHEQRIVRQTIKGSHSISEGWPNALDDQVELVAIRKAM